MFFTESLDRSRGESRISRKGAPNSIGAPTYYLAIFSPKNEENWTEGGARPKFYYIDPPLRRVKIARKACAPLSLGNSGSTSGTSTLCEVLDQSLHKVLSLPVLV